jgi:hypothetical protein
LQQRKLWYVSQHPSVSEDRISRTLDSVHSKLNFVVHLNALGSQDSTLAREHDGRCGLEKEEGLLWLGTVELGNMFPVEYISVCAILIEYMGAYAKLRPIQMTLPACLRLDDAWGAMLAIVRLRANMMQVIENFV